MMNSWLRLLFAFVIDLSLRLVFGLGDWAPDLLLIALVYQTMTRPIGEAYFMAFISGLLWDAVFLDVMGMHSLLFLAVAICAAQLRSLIWGQYAVSRLFLGALFSGTLRFFEVIFWLSTIDYEISVEVSQQYIITGAVVSAIVFMLMPWATRTVPQQTNPEPAVFGRTFEI